MVRTRDNPGRKAVAAKAPRKALVSSPSPAASPSGSKTKYSCAGNRAVSRPVPEWQKGISSFLKPSTSKAEEPKCEEEEETENVDPQVPESSQEPGPSKPQKNGIISDDEDD